MASDAGRPKATAGPPAPGMKTPLRPAPAAVRRAPEAPTGEIPAAFSPEFFAGLNKGPLEAALETRMQDPRNWNRIPWGMVAVGVVIGLLFAYVNLYAAMVTGITVGGSWYVSYLFGMLMRWRPGVINYVAGASTGASQVVLGMAFVVPALFLLSDRNGSDGIPGFTPLYSFDSLPSPFALLGFFIIGGLLGVLFFQFHRRVWIVERPLPYPGGFDSSMQLLAVAAADRESDRAAVRESVFRLSVAAIVSAFVVFLRDLPLVGPSTGRRAFFDDLWPGTLYTEGQFPEPGVYRPLYNGLFFVDPFFLAIGWFVRARIAIILFLGGFVTFLLPFFDGTVSGATPEDVAFGYFAAWGRNARILAAGAILGAGGFALFRLRRTIFSAIRTLVSPRATAFGWPPLWTAGVVAGALLLGIVLLVAGGVPLLAALLVVPVGVLLLAILGVVGVKVTGETSIQAVSPLTLLALLVLIGALQLWGGSDAALITTALGAAAFFATGLVMSTDVFLDTKIGHYVGNPPHRQAIVQAAGLIPGAILGLAAVWYVSGAIVDGDLAAARPVPLGRVFASVGPAFAGGDVPWVLLSLAIGLGIAVEAATGLGTAFAIGMALQSFVTATILVGALARSVAGLIARRWTAGQDAGSALSGLTGLAVPTGMFVGASVAALLVFILTEWIL